MFYSTFRGTRSNSYKEDGLKVFYYAFTNTSTNTNRAIILRCTQNESFLPYVVERRTHARETEKIEEIGEVTYQMVMKK